MLVLGAVQPVRNSAVQNVSVLQNTQIASGLQSLNIHIPKPSWSLRCHIEYDESPGK